VTEVEQTASEIGANLLVEDKGKEEKEKEEEQESQKKESRKRR